MTEQAIYLGDGTAAANILRNARVSAGLQGSPLQWLGTIVAGLLGKRIDVTPPDLQHAQPFARGVLAGLGFDPDTHELGRRRGRWPGFVVRDAAGRPVRFVSGKELAALQVDASFLAAFEQEAA